LESNVTVEESDETTPGVGIQAALLCARASAVLYCCCTYGVGVCQVK
jgi:hypothetical protein